MGRAGVLSRSLQTRRPHGPINAERGGIVSAFLGEIPDFNNHYYRTPVSVTIAVMKIASGRTSAVLRLNRHMSCITVAYHIVTSETL